MGGGTKSLVTIIIKFVIDTRLGSKYIKNEMMSTRYCERQVDTQVMLLCMIYQQIIHMYQTYN